MPIDVTLSGLDAARSDLRAVPALAEQVALDAVQATGKATKQEASRLTCKTYAIAAADLDPYITFTAARSAQGGASVRLLARPLPLSVFRPTVKMQTFTLRSSAGRTYKRKLPTIWLKRFVKGSAKQLKPYFPLHQRSTGPLASDDRAARRIGTPGNFVFNSQGAPSDKLTGVRFYTFPKRFLQKLRPQLVEFIGDRGNLELRGAFRKRFKGMRVLRGPR